EVHSTSSVLFVLICAKILGVTSIIEVLVSYKLCNLERSKDEDKKKRTGHNRECAGCLLFVLVLAALKIA
ncbi:MAG: hypothetical protein PV344_06735, partial [Anaplasma sp.]|nr:hypothetical protein [Anaplasma sp.]